MPKQGCAVAANDRRKRHPHRSVQHVRNGRKAAVQDDVARFGKSFLLQIDDVLQGMLIADNRSHQLEALGFRKDQKRLATEGPFESLLHGDQSLRVIALYKFRRCLTGYNLNRGNRQEYLLTDHLTQNFWAL